MNTDIARARVHIERAFQRLKIFYILKNSMPCKCLSKIDKIVYIICGIVNIFQPITGITGFWKQIFIHQTNEFILF